jgi:Predicted nucleic acid-binding protein, contains PIN domain
MLDTSFAIDYLRGETASLKRFAQLFEEGDEPYVNEVILCELAVGSSTTDDPVFAGFVRAVSFLQPAADAALQAGVWRRDARRRGRTLSLSVSLIAAAADSLGATVLTRNVRDFALTPVSVSSY